MAIRRTYIPESKIANIIDTVNMLLSEGNRVRYVNVHCVGSEFRIKHCSLEDIMGRDFTWYNFDTKETIKLTKFQYDKIHTILNNSWKAQPAPIYEDRGLY